MAAARETSVFDGLGTVMSQGWLYFLGMFLVLASGFYLLSLLWGDLGSTGRQYSVWGSLMAVSIAFSGVGSWMARRNQVLDGAGRAFWVVGFGLLGCASLAAGWADSILMLAPTVAVSAAVGLLTSTFDRGITRYTTAASLTAGVLLLGLSALLPAGPALAAVAVLGVLITWPAVRLLPYANRGGTLREVLMRALPGGFDDAPPPPRMSNLLVFALPLAYVAMLIAAVALVRYGQVSVKGALGWGGAVIALFGLVAGDFDRRARYGMIWAGIGLFLALVGVLPAVVRAESAGVIAALSVAFAASRLAERLNFPRLHHLALAAIYGAFFLALPSNWAWSGAHQILCLTGYVAALALAGQVLPRRFPNLRAVLVEAVLWASPVVLGLWLTDPFWTEIVTDFRGWRPSTLWLGAELAIVVLGVALAAGAQTRRSQVWAYFATLVTVAGTVVFTMGVPRWLGFHVTPWVPVLGIMALAFVLFELAQRIRSIPTVRVWPSPLRYTAYTLAGFEALLCWAQIADWARVTLAFAVVVFFASTALRRNRLGLGAAAFAGWLWAFPVAAHAWAVPVKDGTIGTMGVAWLLAPAVTLALLATLERTRLGGVWARMRAVAAPAAAVLPAVTIAVAPAVLALLYWRAVEDGPQALVLAGFLYAAILYMFAVLYRSPLWVHAGFGAALTTACAVFPTPSPTAAAMVVGVGAAVAYVVPGMLRLSTRGSRRLRSLFGLWCLLERPTALGLWARSHREVAVGILSAAVPAFLFGWSIGEVAPAVAASVTGLAAFIMLVEARRTSSATVRAFWASASQLTLAALTATALFELLPWPARGYVPFLAAAALLVAFHAVLWLLRRDARETAWSAWLSLGALAVALIPWANACAWPTGGWLDGPWGTASLIAAPVIYAAAAALFAARKGYSGVIASAFAMLVLGATGSGVANLVPAVSHFEAWSVVALALSLVVWLPGVPVRIARSVGAGVAAYGFLATVGLFVLDPTSALFTAAVTTAARGLVALRAPAHSRWWWLFGLDLALTAHAATLLWAGPADAPFVPYLSVLALACAGIGAFMMQLGRGRSLAEGEQGSPFDAIARAGVWLLLAGLFPLAIDILSEHLGTTLERVAFSVALGVMTVAWIREASRQLKTWMAWIGVGAFFWLYAYVRIALDFGTEGMDPWVLMGMAFGLLGVHTWLVRGPSDRQARALLGKVAQHVAMALPWVALGTAFVADGEVRIALWLTASLWYALMGWQSRRKGWSLPATLLANCGVICIWMETGVTDPMFYAVPVGISILALGALFRRDLPAGVNLGIDLVGGLVIYFSGMYEVVAFHSIWDVLTVAGLAAAGMLLGIMLRVRSYLYLGALFLVADVGYNLFRIGMSDRVIGMVFLFGAGVLVLAFAVLFTLKRDELKQRYADTWATISAWE